MMMWFVVVMLVVAGLFTQTLVGMGMEEHGPGMPGWTYIATAIGVLMITAAIIMARSIQ